MPLPSHRAARRRRHREAVLGAVPPRGGTGAAAGRPLDALTGTVLDASPHLLVMRTADGEARLPMTEGTKVWHGGPGGLAALRPGRQVIARPADDGLAAGRIWVDIVRIAGTILACGRDAVEVDMGPHRGRTHVAIPPHALGRVLVRHPRLEPGYLIDLICVSSAGTPVAVRPGTSQPGHRADDLASPEPTVPVAESVNGTVTWFGGLSPGGAYPVVGGLRAGADRPRARAGSAHPAGEGNAGVGLSAWGAAYPAVDPEGDAGGCSDAPSGCVALPYLSLGSELIVHNECSGRAAKVEVVECGCLTARFCDRCVECATSPRGRIVELTPAAFAGLGGNLDAGCFNALVGPGAPSAPPFEGERTAIPPEAPPAPPRRAEGW